MSNLAFLLSSLIIGLVIYGLVRSVFTKTLERRYVAGYEEIELDVSPGVVGADAQIRFCLPPDVPAPANRADFEHNDWGSVLLELPSRSVKHIVWAIIALLVAAWCCFSVIRYHESIAIFQLLGLLAGVALAAAVTLFLKRKQRILFYSAGFAKQGVLRTWEHSYTDIKRIKFLQYNKNATLTLVTVYGRWICEIVLKDSTQVVISSKDYADFKKKLAVWHQNLSWQ